MTRDASLREGRDSMGYRSLTVTVTDRGRVTFHGYDINHHSDDDVDEY